jgi:transaldolase
VRPGPIQELHDLGQSLWLDNLSRELITSGTLERYIDRFCVTGLTSNPSIFDQAIAGGTAYDESIRAKRVAAASAESLFFEVAFEDLRIAADLFRPVHERTDGVDGWVSIEVSPLLADDAAGTIQQARELHARGERPNLFVKIPGTAAGNEAIEECVFEGVPINVTLLFSRDQYVASAEAFMRGVERRVKAGLNPAVASVASVFISRWDRAILERVPPELRNRLGIAVARQTYRSYRDLLESARWLRLANYGARPQRLLWASTGTKDPAAPDVLYLKALAAPFTINTIPDKTLEAFADHGEVGDLLPRDGGDAAMVLGEFAKASIDVQALAARLQTDGAEAFDRSWHDLLACIESKRTSLIAG